MDRKELYIPPNFFNKRDEHGNLLCRLAKCNKEVRFPFRYFCSRSHAKDFARWHFLHCTWIGVRLAIFKRDDYKCQKCGKTWDTERIIKQTKRNMRFLNFANVLDVKGTDLECDHILPVAQLFADVNIKTKIRRGNPTHTSNKLLLAKKRLLSYDNLRTLCSKCHSKVTVNFTLTRHYESKVRSSAETAAAMIRYYSIGEHSKKL